MSHNNNNYLISTMANDNFITNTNVPWEDRIGQSNTLKEDRYMELTLDLRQKGYKVWFFALEVGARGMVGQSTYTFLREIGLTIKVRSKALADMSRAAEAASQWIFLREIASDLLIGAGPPNESCEKPPLRPARIAVLVQKRS